jgi:RHS repeat-associated protein
MYWHGLGGEVLMESDFSGGNQVEHIYFNGQRIAKREANGTVYFFFDDHLGNIRVTTNGMGVVKDEFDPYPHGWFRTISFTSGDWHLFTNHEYDPDTLLHYMRARHYSPAAGRFLQPDPLSVLDKLLVNPQDLNLYTYTINNPLRYQDPNGEDWIDVAAGVLEGSANFVTNVAVVAAYSVASVTPVGGILGAQQTLAEGAVAWVTTAASAYANDGLSGVASQVADQGEQGAIATVTEAVAWGALAAGGAKGPIESVAGTGAKAVPTAPGVGANAARGAASESRVLGDIGATKNTKPVTATEGKSIPDFQNSRVVGEIKDANRVSNTQQIRIQKEAAQQSGRQHQLITGTKTNVTKNAARGTNVTRRSDLGPQ